MKATQTQDNVWKIQTNYHQEDPGVLSKEGQMNISKTVEYTQRRHMFAGKGFLLAIT